MDDTKELTWKEIEELTDLDQMGRQARLNTIAAYKVRQQLDGLTVGTLRASLVTERDGLTGDDPKRETLSRQIELLADEESDAACGYLVHEEERLTEMIRQRQKRAAGLIRRRNTLDAEKKKKHEEAVVKAREEAPKRLWGEELDRRRRQLLQNSVELLRDVEVAHRSLRGDEDRTFEFTMMTGLMQNLNTVVAVLKRVPAFRPPE